MDICIYLYMYTSVNFPQILIRSYSVPETQQGRCYAHRGPKQKCSLSEKYVNIIHRKFYLGFGLKKKKN